MFSPRADTSSLVSLTSSKNPLLREVRQAVDHGGLTRTGLAVAEGIHLLEEALASEIEISAVLCSDSGWAAVERLISSASEIRIVRMPDDTLSSVSSTETTQGVITLVRPPEYSVETVFREPALAVLLDGVQDPGNAGAILRVAEAFGATGVIALKGTVSLWNPKAIRASAGSVLRLPVLTGVTDDAAVAMLRDYAVATYAAMPRSPLFVSDAEFRSPCCMIVGGEGAGIRSRLIRAAQHVSIPTTRVESLNAAVAAGIILYEAARQRRSA